MITAIIDPDDTDESVPGPGPAAPTPSVRDRAGEQYVSASWRADEHALASARWLVVHRGLMVAAAVLAAVAAGALFSRADGGWAIGAGVLASLAAVLSGISSAVDPSARAAEHRRGLAGYTRLRSRWMELRDVTAGLDRSDEQLAREFYALLDEQDRLTTEVPAPPPWARARVRKLRTDSN
jgi:hypothetical protein